MKPTEEGKEQESDSASRLPMVIEIVMSIFRQTKTRANARLPTETQENVKFLVQLKHKVTAECQRNSEGPLLDDDRAKLDAYTADLDRIHTLRMTGDEMISVKDFVKFLGILLEPHPPRGERELSTDTE